MKDKENQLLQELRNTLSKMELSLDAIDDAIVWVDEFGTIQWSNKKFSELVNVSKIETLGNPIQNFLSLKLKDKFIDWADLISDNLNCDNYCVYEWLNNDSLRYLEVSAKNFQKLEKEINVVIVLRDITTNYTNEINKSKLAAIVESTDDAIISRTIDGIIESWNKGAERLYGYKANEAIGKSAIFIYPENHKEEFYYSTELVKNGRPFEINDTERLHKNGQIISVSVMMSPIHNELGEIIGSCSIAKDISELKAMMNIKNDFISTVSHELRTPLTSIEGSLSLLAEGTAGDLSDDAKILLNIGKNNTARLIRLINDILDIQKIESGRLEFHYEPYDLVNLVQEAILANEGYANRFNIKIELIKKSTATVNADRDRILQVMTNLISNAVKFSSGAVITICIYQKDDLIRIEVTNKGVGIPKEFYSRIFQKFSQVRGSQSARAKGGTGLGLSISKEIVEKHGGKIGFTSEENNETTFYFELPIYKMHSEKQHIFEKIPTVLICEDDNNLANYLKAILEKNTIKIMVVNTAKDAKKVVASQYVDAILLDLILPDQDGITLIKDLKELNANLSIVVLSVISKEGVKELKGSTISVIDWIEKPIDLNKLIKAIQLLKKEANKKALNILHIEDDVDLMQVICTLLQYDANIFGVTTLKEAKEKLNEMKYDLVILDLMLPDGSGIEVLPLLSAKKIPVLVFSAYELPKNYTSYVIKSLLKAKTTSAEFVESIKEILARKK